VIPTYHYSQSHVVCDVNARPGYCTGRATEKIQDTETMKDLRESHRGEI